MSEYTSINYRIRAGTPMPTSEEGQFVLHSFRAEKHNSIVYTCKEDILPSSAFRGQGGGFSSASYNRLPVTGAEVYRATQAENVVDVEEIH